ncbi:MAG: VOC family protein [Candidatus Kerfeldbacteria bacterium]|nr:VOC family protein [Candidatus Kerfeldbacteria bacterium]
MPTLNPHILFNGNAEEAMHFYQSVFGGEFTNIIQFKDLPASPDMKLDEAEANKYLNIALSVGGTILLSANDVPSMMGKVNENENRSKIAVTAASKDEADKLFNGLSVGGQVEMPMGESPWGTYFAMFRDKFGIEWTIAFQ